MAPRKPTKPAGPPKVAHYLSGWADDTGQTMRHLSEVLIDALCALKRLQLQGALDAYPEWRGEGNATVQLGVPKGADAKPLKKHPFLPAGSPLMVITGSTELTSSMVGFARGVSTRWRRRIVTGTAAGPAKLPAVMMVSGASLVVAEGSVFAEKQALLEEAGWKVRALGPSELSAGT
jgi:hypothetical protein